MKEWHQLKDYRRKYERFYGEPIPDGYDVHHIDTNRKNNSIINLIAVPKDVHRRYHKALQDLEQTIMGNLRDISVRDVFTPGMMTGAQNMPVNAISEAITATEELTRYIGVNEYRFFREASKRALELGVSYHEIIRM